MKQSHLMQVIQKQRIEAFNAGRVSTINVMVVALNEKFGFGRDRLLKLMDSFNELFDEYGELVAGDISYGSKKLNDRVKQIMKE